MAKDETEQALPLLEQTENDKSIPDDLRQLAALTAVRLQAEQESPPENLQDRLQKIWSNKKSPWTYHAHLQTALLLAQTQNFDEARQHLNDILDAPDLPETLYTKARALDKVYGLKSYEQNKNKPRSRGREAGTGACEISAR